MYVIIALSRRSREESLKSCCVAPLTHFPNRPPPPLYPSQNKHQTQVVFHCGMVCTVVWCFIAIQSNTENGETPNRITDLWMFGRQKKQSIVEYGMIVPIVRGPKGTTRYKLYRLRHCLLGIKKT